MGRRAHAYNQGSEWSRYFVVMKPPLSTLPQVGAFSFQSIYQTLQNLQVKCLASLTRRNKYYVQISYRIDGTNKHRLDTGLQRTFFRGMMALNASIDLIVASFLSCNRSTSFHQQWWPSIIDPNQLPIVCLFFNVRHALSRHSFWSSVSMWSTNFAATIFTRNPSLKIY